MIRKLLIAFGIFEIVRPRPVIDACERIGLQNPNEAQLRAQAIQLARLEGIVVVYLLYRRRRGSRSVAVLLALVGAFAILTPHPLIRLTQRIAYENADELELQRWVTPATRALGACYLLVAFLGWNADDETTGSDA